MEGRLLLSYWDLIAENQIKDAMQKGAFSKLRNQGKPLPNSNDELAGENWIANHILEQNDVLPDWLSLRKDIVDQKAVVKRFRNEAIERLEQLPNRLWPTDARLRRLYELYRKHAQRLNLMIDEHNHRCPSLQHELIRVREDALERAREELRRRRAKEFVQRSDAERPR
jgi:DNA repair ATPase RecN